MGVTGEECAIGGGLMDGIGLRDRVEVVVFGLILLDWLDLDLGKSFPARL